MENVNPQFTGKLRSAVPTGLKALLSGIVRRRVAKTAQLDDRKKITLAPNTFIDHYCILRPAGGAITFKDRSYLGPFCVILGTGGVHIGSEVMIGPHTVIASGNHDFKQRKQPMQWGPMSSDGPIVIEDDVWIGAHCLICDNVTIATGSVIAGGSVVTKCTEPYGIYAGVPAKKIGTRLIYDS